MNNKTQYQFILFLTTCLISCGCKPDAVTTAPPMTVESIEKERAINAAPGWSICNKGGYEVGRIKNVPGYIRDIVGFQVPHPSIDLTPYNMDGGWFKLLKRSQSFDEYVALLKEKGYTVVPTPHDNNNACVVSTAAFNNAK